MSVRAESILELGIGTGETARRVLERHPGARLVAIDSSEDMVAVASGLLPGADVRTGHLEEPLPDGPFDLVVSALSVHHLSAAGKAPSSSTSPGGYGPAAGSSSATSSSRLTPPTPSSRSSRVSMFPTAWTTSSRGCKPPP